MKITVVLSDGTAAIVETEEDLGFHSLSIIRAMAYNLMQGSQINLWQAWAFNPPNPAAEVQEEGYGKQ
jgi:hypothetical protein